MPLVAGLLEDGSLVAPFHEGFVSNRAYWLVQSPLAQGRSEVTAFVDWLIREGEAQQKHVKEVKNEGSEGSE